MLFKCAASDSFSNATSTMCNTSLIYSAA